MIKDLDWQSAAELLYAGVEALNQSLSMHQSQALVSYLKLLDKWNNAYNLTSISDWQGMVVKHLLDSISVNPWINGKQIMDVGTGAGIPGFPLAILNPDKAFTLLDTNGKKTRFMTQVKAELGIDNVTVVKARIETFQPDSSYDQIICRAYSSLEKFIKEVHHIKQPGRCMELLAMKGQLPEQELLDIKSLSVPVEVVSVETLQVPFLDERRHLIRLMLKTTLNQ
jgi:16S rRNA (guanine527-N7)-methyltransferase